jgi:D-serine deaminase-like pyridoxal phosphate-dependent protein
MTATTAKPTSLSNIPLDIPTPTLVIDKAVALRNIKKLADYSKKHNLGVRPHTKTHKSIFFAKEQVKAGAVGLTVAKVGEAEVMANACNDLLLAYPALDPFRTGRIADLAKTHTMRVGLDSAYAADAIAAAAVAAGSTVGILVDLDLGFHRTGVQNPAEALALAQHISKTKGLRFDGVMFFPGNLWGDEPKMIQDLAALSVNLDEILLTFRKHGLEAKIVSGGSTPTAWLSHHVAALTETRPGTYIYNDRNCITVNVATIDDCAARIIATVVSNAVPGKVVLDCGTKTLTSDRLILDPNTAGHGYIVEYPKAKLVRLSEEHGEMDLTGCDRVPKLGERVQVIPNHICPCVNLQPHAYIKHENGSLEKVVVDARGLLS